VGRCSFELEAVLHVSVHAVLLVPLEERRFEFETVQHVRDNSLDLCSAGSVENHNEFQGACTELTKSSRLGLYS
jgi:hypothetical protein